MAAPPAPDRSDDGKPWPATQLCAARLKHLRDIIKEIVAAGMSMEATSFYVRRSLQNDRPSDEWTLELDDVHYYLSKLRELFQHGASECLLLQAYFDTGARDDSDEPRFKRARIDAGESMSVSRSWYRDPTAWVDRQWEGCLGISFARRSILLFFTYLLRADHAPARRLAISCLLATQKEPHRLQGD